MSRELTIFATKKVSRDEFYKHVRSHKVTDVDRCGIVEPPIEAHYNFDDGIQVGRICLLDSYGMENEYYINE